MRSRRKLSAVLVLGTALAGAVATASAEDVPNRKPGLWEIKSSMQGVPANAMPATQQCIDEKTDVLMQQRAGQSGACKQMDIKRDGERTTIHSVCTHDQVTATTDAVFTGSFDSSYRGDIKVKYEPPMQGVSQSAMTLQARWLGPCKPGQKPGDIMINGMKFNPAQMGGPRPKMPPQ